MSSGRLLDEHPELTRITKPTSKGVLLPVVIARELAEWVEEWKKPE